VIFCTSILLSLQNLCSANRDQIQVTTQS
jgi:hypothetical protein